MARINIVCDDANGGWIYSEFIKHFKELSGHTILINEKDQSKYDAVYYLPYYLYDKPTSKPCSAWFSHREEKQPLRDKFISAGRQVDIAVSQSVRYMNVLQNSGVKNIVQIKPGVDGFKPAHKEVIGKKLIVGNVGRNYKSSNRKNPGLLAKIAKLDWVDLRSTNGKLAANQIPDFINSCHICVSPSLQEGGPLITTQALACAIPTLCYDDVGVAREFGYGVIKVPFNKEDAFINRLYGFWKNKEWLEYRQAENILKMTQQVKEYSWDNFVESHDKVFDQLMKGR